MNDHSGIEQHIEHFIHRLADRMLQQPQRLRLRLEISPDNCTVCVTIEPWCDKDAGMFIGSKGVLFGAWRTLLTQLCGRLGYTLHLATVTQPSNHCQSAVLDHTLPELESAITDAAHDLFERPFTLELVRNTVLLTLDEQEPKHVADLQLEDALSRVINSVGKASGLPLYLKLAREEQHA